MDLRGGGIGKEAVSEGDGGERRWCRTEVVSKEVGVERKWTRSY